MSARILKNIGFYLLVMIITGFVYWVIYMDRESKHITLEYALNMLGEDLLAMVPGLEEKKPVKVMYEDFVERAKEKEISPEQIERVAAKIMNLSNMDTTLTPKEVRTMLEEPLAGLPEAPPVPDDKNERIPGVPAIGDKRPAKTDWTDMAERIKSLHEFNLEMQKLNRKKLDSLRIRHIIPSKEGLKLIMDVTVLDRMRHEEIIHKIQELETKHILEWENKLEKEIIHLDSLRVLKELEKLEEIESNKLYPPPELDKDSLRHFIEKHREDIEKNKQ